MRYEISYRSDYRYDGPVAGNLNRLRMRPSDGGTQRTEHFDVRVAPDALRHDHHDFSATAWWGSCAGAPTSPTGSPRRGRCGRRGSPTALVGLAS